MSTFPTSTPSTPSSSPRDMFYIHNSRLKNFIHKNGHQITAGPFLYIGSSHHSALSVSNSFCWGLWCRSTPGTSLRLHNLVKQRVVTRISILALIYPSPVIREVEINKERQRIKFCITMQKQFMLHNQRDKFSVEPPFLFCFFFPFLCSLYWIFLTGY